MPADDYLSSNGLLGWMARWPGDSSGGNQDALTSPTLASAGYAEQPS